MPANLSQALGFLIGVWLAIVLLTPLGARGDTRQQATEGLDRLEHEIFQDVNRWRSQRHLPSLERLPALDAVARRHSADMSARGYFSHDTPEGRNPVDRIVAGGIEGFALAAENVGMTNRPDPTPEILHGWLTSPDHYENLSAPVFNATGVGIARRSDGTLFYTQVYVTFPR